MSAIDHRRSELLSAVDRVQHIHVAYEHPYATGPRGEKLTTDAIWIGPHDAPAVTVIISGTHGIEGVIGSLIQQQWLQSRQRSHAVASLLIHLINPYGYAWSRRCDEHNVDVNRNFIDFGRALPANPEYAARAAAIAPVGWFGAERQAADHALMQWVGEAGPRVVQSVLTKGQYHYGDGLFFGGLRPSWSREIIARILDRFLKNVRRFVAVDIHTGLGSYGNCQLIQKAGSLGTAAKIMGPVIAAGDDESVATAITGSLAEWLPHKLAAAEAFSFVAEFGTIPALDVLMALRRDNWLHHHGDLNADYVPAIKAAMRAAFIPEDPVWRSSVIGKALEIIENAHSLSGQRFDAKEIDPRLSRPLLKQEGSNA